MRLKKGQTERVPLLQPSRGLNALYDRINSEYFEDRLPPCQIKWSRQLTRAAGNIDVRNRVIKLSVPLLVDSYASEGVSYEICGVKCESREHATWEILKHEMIHLWLHELGLPSGHTAAFRAKAKAIGQPRTRHGIARPVPKSGWLYTCPRCEAQVTRRRRFGRPVACGGCCKKYCGGHFDARFQLKGRQIRVETTATASVGSHR
ncbi:hypothetical protein EON80_23900 [bacterium]|nr:MAG: hypothetical protein EON80_23900 [bacterium]